MYRQVVCLKMFLSPTATARHAEYFPPVFTGMAGRLSRRGEWRWASTGGGCRQLRNSELDMSFVQLQGVDRSTMFSPRNDVGIPSAICTHIFGGKLLGIVWLFFCHGQRVEAWLRLYRGCTRRNLLLSAFFSYLVLHLNTNQQRHAQYVHSN